MRLLIFFCTLVAASVAPAADDWRPAIATRTTTVEVVPFLSGLNGSLSGVNQLFPTKMTPILDGSGHSVVSTFGGLLRVIEGNGIFLDDPLSFFIEGHLEDSNHYSKPFVPRSSIT